MNEFREYDSQELDDMETLGEGHSQDLKVDAGGFRVWQDRTGEDYPVTYEIRVGGRWCGATPDEDGNWVINT